MKSFFDFVQQTGAALPGPTTREAISGGLRMVDAPAESLEKFASEAFSMISSQDFLRELSADIGEPRPGETKEEFVSRAKAVAAKLLEKRLK